MDTSLLSQHQQQLLSSALLTARPGSLPHTDQQHLLKDLVKARGHSESLGPARAPKSPLAWAPLLPPMGSSHKSDAKDHSSLHNINIRELESQQEDEIAFGE